jgi:hypothetical protein
MALALKLDRRDIVCLFEGLGVTKDDHWNLRKNLEILSLCARLGA